MDKCTIDREGYGLGFDKLRDLSSLHEIRNLAQHNASVPSQAEIERHIQPVSEMLRKIFRELYHHDFDNFTVWDLIENEELRRWLQDAEFALEAGEAEISIAASKVAYGLVISAIRKHSIGTQFAMFSVGSFAGFPRDVSSRLADRFRRVEEKLRYLENEMVAIGMGMPLVDTRRFQRAGRDVLVFHADSGDIQIRGTGPPNRAELAEGARFMLNYLSRMIRLVYEVYPGVIETVEVKKPLRQQQIWAGLKPRAESTCA